MLTLFPSPDPDELEVRSKAKLIIDEHLRPFARQDDQRHYFRREVFEKFAGLGYVAMTVPENYGGRAASSRSYYAFIEELARTNMAVAVSVGVTNLVQGALLAFGTEAQKKTHLRKLASGEWLGAFSLSEPNSGSDAASLQCRAVAAKGGYRVTGSKVWCSNAGIADVYLLMARTSNDRARGITSFLVPKDTPGFRIGKLEQKLGLSSSTLGELVFEDCFLPEALRIGEEGEGLAVALSQLDSGRIGIATVGLGVGVETIEKLWKYRTDLEAKGVPFDEGIQQRFAGYLAELQAVKLLIWEAASRKDKGERISLLASQSKLLGSDLAMRITSDAVEFSGVRGYTSELEFERMMRDSKALQIVEGTNQVQRLVISREITKELSR